MRSPSRESLEVSKRTAVSERWGGNGPESGAGIRKGALVGFDRNQPFGLAVSACHILEKGLAGVCLRLYDPVAEIVAYEITLRRDDPPPRG